MLVSSTVLCKKRRYIAMLICMAIVSCASPVPFAPSTSSAKPVQRLHVAAPRLTPIACPMPLPAQYKEGKNIECSYLIVKEDRAVANSRDLRLAVARVKSSDPHPAADPLIMLQGGPGGALLSSFDYFVSAGAVKKEIGKRDIILLDQRGTGYSQPSMKCDEETTTTYAQLEQNLSAMESLKQQDAATMACRTRLSGQLHIDLNAYNTLANANDVHDLITALKVPQANLYGVSYGTRLVLEVMRSFPQQVRSVILDSAVPAQINFVQENPNAIARVYRTLFNDCAAEPTCAQAHPQLEQRFWSFVAQAQKQPLSIRLQDPTTKKVYAKAVFTGSAFAQGFWNMFYITGLIPSIPAIMEQVMRGDSRLFAQIYDLLAFDQSVNTGMYHSVVCNENENRSSRARIEENVHKLDPAIQQDNALTLEDTVIAQCQIWNVKAEPAVLQQPVKSAIPALVMEGSYDPVTPPAYGREVAQSLTKSYQFLAPSTGHGVYLSGQACPVQVAEAFLQSPEQAPATNCLQQMEARPGFL